MNPVYSFRPKKTFFSFEKRKRSFFETIPFSIGGKKSWLRDDHFTDDNNDCEHDDDNDDDNNDDDDDNNNDNNDNDGDGDGGTKKSVIFQEKTKTKSHLSFDWTT